ncbi:unnamed protein product [Ambrosiozyma monospora]|uniref:Unnamed protein product n=1 Tax=Ambrosiozyma monospora TaxID=43982 RepID=A0ACB5T7J7_AMBMO|nr:unnamed protein product [Ambrosiozyma monospora]
MSLPYWIHLSVMRLRLLELSGYLKVVPIADEEIKLILKKTFRLYFLKDVVLARLLDDVTFNCIQTMIHVNEDKVLKFLQNDEQFLTLVFGLYDDVPEIKDDTKDQSTVDNDTSDTHSKQQDSKLVKQREAIKLIHQFVLTAKKFQPMPRSDFYRSLLDRGLFRMIKFAFKDTEIESRVLATELIVCIIEHDVLLFNKPTHDSSNKEIELDTMLIVILTDVLINERNIGLKTQAFEALKVLLDPANIAGSSPESGGSLDGSSNTSSSEICDELAYNFLSGFYESSADKLFEPFSKIDLLIKTHKNSKIIDKNTTISYSNLCELVSFISKEHDKLLSRSFILENKLLIGVAKLVGDNFSYQLRLSALRCLKSIILLDDEFFTRYIIQNDILRNFMLLLKETNNGNNLINSTCLSLLSYISQNDNFVNFKLLRDHLVMNYGPLLKENFLGIELINSKKKQDEEEQREREREAISLAVGSATTSFSLTSIPAVTTVRSVGGLTGYLGSSLGSSIGGGNKTSDDKSVSNNNDGIHDHSNHKSLKRRKHIF